jgi:hypothetical protein
MPILMAVGLCAVGKNLESTAVHVDYSEKVLNIAISDILVA